MMLAKLQRYSGDIGIGLLIVTVLVLIIVPIPLMLLDALLAVNLTVSVLLLMVVMYVPDVVSLSTFPTLLLFTTMFRLALNIASTKLILLTADAGHVIEAFGNLVVGGNPVVGFVIFIIITIVQFIVIAKGSERVAEVGARFTLDALPGKQMSIDADLRAGNLTAEQARSKRERLAMESAVHGGMDGAMKFVKGDAVAGLVITAINVLGGIIIGVLYLDMTTAEAANRFTVLSIGDAMVSQIPSLLMCVASGVLVTRVADDRRTAAGSGSVGLEIGEQLLLNPRPLMMGALLTLGFAAIPGFPILPFLVLSGTLGVLAYQRHQRARKSEGSAGSAPLPALMREGAKATAPTIQNKPREFTSPLTIRISAALSQALDVPSLNTAFASERDALQESLGLPFPGIEVVIGSELQPLAYAVLIYDVPAGGGELQANALMLVDGDPAMLEQCETYGAAGGMDQTHWLATAHARDIPAGRALTHEQVLARHAVGAMQSQAHLFMGIQEVQWILEKAVKDYPSLVGEAMKAVPTIKIAEVLRRLLEEQVPVRNVRAILESLAAWGAKEKDTLMLTEYARGELGRFLAYRAADGREQLEAVLLDSAVEQTVRQAIKQTPAGNFLALPPETIDQITEAVLRLAGHVPSAGRALVTSMDIRRYLRKMIERRAPWLQVYSFQELGGHVELRSLGRVQI
jgi:type III secretion protein V